MQLTKISTVPFFLGRAIMLRHSQWKRLQHHKQDFNRSVVWCSDFSVYCFAVWGTGC